jgi:hypothetical protein
LSSHAEGMQTGPVALSNTFHCYFDSIDDAFARFVSKVSLRLVVVVTAEMANP